MALRDLIIRNLNGNKSSYINSISPQSFFDNDVDRLFDTLWNNFDVIPSRVLKGKPNVSFSPDINISEDDKSIEVKAELPGIDEKDINVTLDKGLLTIEGVKNNETTDKNKDFHRVECSYGKFSRTIRVSEEVEVENIKAGFKNGVLKVSLPKTQPSKSDVRKIEIKSS